MLQLNHYHQQTRTQLFTGRMPFLSPNQQCQSTEGKISHPYGTNNYLSFLTVFILVNEIGNAECCSNLEADTAVLLQNKMHHTANIISHKQLLLCESLPPLPLLSSPTTALLGVLFNKKSLQVRPGLLIISQKKIFGDCDVKIFTAACPSCYPINRVQALVFV